LRSQSTDVLTVRADVTDQVQVEHLLARVRDHYGRLDVLVNSAGRSARGTVQGTTPEEFRELWELNFLAAVRCTNAALPFLLATRGHVVQIGSLSAKLASRYLGAYPSSKFALAAYAQQLRLELGPEGLHVLLVCPGPLVRDDAGRRYATDKAELPAAARQPGGGVKIRAIDPDWLAERIVAACRRRQAELVVPAKARLLFALAQLSPKLGDWIVRRMT
jgi:NAD(P)-dependent dehydrogenase (short-subunit alcohol dehydrogenase family)